ncbi:MAG: hypothetical protein ACKKMP_03615 [Candidatus Nealsonbacteria bacterium]
MDNTKILKNIEKRLSALLLLLLEARESYPDNKKGKEAKKVELLLHKAGFKNSEIASLINKNLAAVQKTLQRSRKVPKK